MFKLSTESKPDIAVCSQCGWEGSVEQCDHERDGDFESGFFMIDLCPKCPDGGNIDDYKFSNNE